MTDNRIEISFDNPTPERRAATHAQMARYAENREWFEAHLGQIAREHAGRVVCVAGRELFAAATAAEAWALGRGAHPDDDGMFVQFVSPDRGPKVYGDLR